MGIARNFIERIKNIFRKPGEGLEPIQPPPLAPFPTLEVFSQAGHGKSSYLWAVLYMLRKMNMVWPDYLCWPGDESTDNLIKQIHENVAEAHLPMRGATENKHRYDLRLRNMERWGEKKFVVWDWPDPVFAADLNGDRPEKTNWLAPAWWLVSLPDLGEVRAEVLDMHLDDLMRKRVHQGFSVYRSPLRLIVVLTKGDAVPNLPLPLRQYLKDDPLWKAVSSEVSLLSPPASSLAAPLRLGEEPLRLYLGTLMRAHEVIRQWLESTLVGHMLIRRAAEYHVDLRFAIVSSTGSGLVEGQDLQVPWTPRRVLDPLFWALELDSALAR